MLYELKFEQNNNNFDNWRKKKFSSKTFVKWYVIPLLAIKLFLYSRLQIKLFSIRWNFFSITYQVYFREFGKWIKLSVHWTKLNSVYKLFVFIVTISESDRSDSYENAFKKNIDLINQLRSECKLRLSPMLVSKLFSW